MREIIRRLVRLLGYDIAKFNANHPFVRRKLIVHNHGIRTVLDVGANAGQFGIHMRGDIGFTGRIISFEPLCIPFAALKALAEQDRNWEVFNFGLGDANTVARINIAANSCSSSLLDATGTLLEVAPQVSTLGVEDIGVRTLDSVFPSLACQEPIYLKIDTQGFERRVLLGAMDSLRNVDTIQVEMGLMPMYKGATSFLETSRLLQDSGYELVSIEPGLVDYRTGHLLEVDGTFVRVMRP